MEDYKDFLITELNVETFCFFSLRTLLFFQSPDNKYSRKCALSQSENLNINFFFGGGGLGLKFFWPPHFQN